jgi:hypothetical protein
MSITLVPKLVRVEVVLRVQSLRNSLSYFQKRPDPFAYTCSFSQSRLMYSTVCSCWSCLLQVIHPCRTRVLCSSCSVEHYGQLHGDSCSTEPQGLTNIALAWFETTWTALSRGPMFDLSLLSPKSPELGTIKSAWTLLGSTNSSCIGLTVA